MDALKKDEFWAGFFFGIAAVCGITLTKLYSKYRKVSERMSRHEAFLKESNAWKAKYPNEPETPEARQAAIDEFKDIMDLYL